MPPGNVDTIFAYSWAIGFLTGNARWSGCRSAPARLLARHLVEIVAATLAAAPAIAAGSAFVATYRRDEAITAALWARADLRVGLGWRCDRGRPAAVPLSPLAREIVFADRLSLAILDAPSWLAQTEAERVRRARLAYGDLFSFDQMACSSPRILVWRGDLASVDQAAASFDIVLRAEIQARG